MKKWERIGAVIMLLIGLGSAGMALNIGFGTFTSPGPGFFPLWLALLLAIIAGLYLVSLRGGGNSAAAFWPAGSWRRPALAMVMMFGYTVLLENLGFCTATLLLFAGWLRIIERRRWQTVLWVAFGGAVSAYLLFAFLLEVPLPKGVLF